MKTQSTPAGMPHPAFVRGEDGMLHIRHFSSAADAAAAACGRELPTPAQIEAVSGRRAGWMLSPEFAKHLGVHPVTIRRQWARGGLPGCREDGPRLLRVPTRLLRLAHAYGLRGVERMAKAGLLASAGQAGS